MLPDKINICPIVDTVVEIRFNSKLFSNAIFGIIYNKFQKEYTSVEKLPILQIPEQLREVDPNFKFKPHYKISNGVYTIQIGPDVLTIGSPMPYDGWTKYSKHIFSFYKELFALGIISQVTRLGVRYVNFFNFDIYSKIKLSLSIVDAEHNCNNTVIRTETIDNDITNLIQIANNVTFARDGKTLTGSIIDIDSHKEYSDGSFLIEFENEVSKAHLAEKNLFFSLLKEEFLESLSPVFDDRK